MPPPPPPPPQWERERVFRSVLVYLEERAPVLNLKFHRIYVAIFLFCSFTKHFSFRNFWLTFMCAAAAIS